MLSEQNGPILRGFTQTVLHPATPHITMVDPSLISSGVTYAQVVQQGVQL